MKAIRSQEDVYLRDIMVYSMSRSPQRLRQWIDRERSTLRKYNVDHVLSSDFLLAAPIARSKANSDGKFQRLPMDASVPRM